MCSGAIDRPPGFHLSPVTAAEAEDICRWHYPAPFDLYDLYAHDVPLLLDRTLRYHAVRDADGQLAGFACFGEDAQVLGWDYDDTAIDIGLGLAPHRLGHGHGQAFVAAIAAHAAHAFAPKGLRLSVATFNTRAVIVYRRLGFVAGPTFQGNTRHGYYQFDLMQRPGQAPAACGSARLCSAPADAPR